MHQHQRNGGWDYDCRIDEENFVGVMVSHV